MTTSIFSGKYVKNQVLTYVPDYLQNKESAAFVVWVLNRVQEDAKDRNGPRTYFPEWDELAKEYARLN